MNGDPFRGRIIGARNTPADVALYHPWCGLQETFPQQWNGAQPQEWVKSPAKERRIYEHKAVHSRGQSKDKRKPDASTHRYSNDVRLFDTVQVQEANYHADKEINRIASGRFVRAAGPRKLERPKTKALSQLFECTFPILYGAPETVKKKDVSPAAFRPETQLQSVHFCVVILRKSNLHRSHRTSLSE